LKRKLLSIIFITFLTARSTLPHVVPVLEEKDTIADNAIYVVSHGWHTGIVVPRDRLLENIPELRTRFNYGKYLEIGWGDKGFYQAKEITSGLTIRAIFWPTDSVVHVVSVPASPLESFPQSEVRKLCLSQNQVESLGKFISGSFQRAQSGSIVSLKNGIYGDSQFYAGKGSFYLTNTCNKWTAKGLRSAGYDISPAFKLTASSIIDYIDSHENPNKRMHSDKVPATRSLCR